MVDVDKDEFDGFGVSEEAALQLLGAPDEAAPLATYREHLEFANIREMHQLSAVGTAKEASVDDKGLYLAAKIVDDTAWGKVTSGVYDLMHGAGFAMAPEDQQPPDGYEPPSRG